MRARACVLWFIILLVLASFPVVLAQAAPPGLQAGNFEASILSQGRRRTFLLHIPPPYQQGNPAPLVINFHGRGGDPQSFAINSRLVALADQEGFVAVFPQALGRPSTWSIIPGGRGPDDVQFARDLIAEMQEQLSIDPKRIYLIGYSNGGGMVAQLACELSETVAAVASVSGVYYLANNCQPSQQVPILTIHGTADPIVPYVGDPGALLGAAAWAQSWAGRNGCNFSPDTHSFSVTTDQGEVTVSEQVWSACREDAEVILQSYQGLGHQFPASTAPDAIWNFFEQHRLSPTPE